MDGNHSRLDRIEAALERIAERHEALTQTVEIIAGMQKENEKRIQQLSERVAQLGDRVGELTERVGQATDLMLTLTSIVRRHEERLERLEGGS
jgi:chromosome segregation ATPase